jgi:hypothetical protein
MGDIIEAKPEVGEAARSERGLRIAVRVALLGVAVAIGATFLTWISNKYRSGQAYSGWDLVTSSPDRAISTDPQWTVSATWADRSPQLVFTALPVITVCGVAILGAVGVWIGTWRRVRTLTVVSGWVVLFSGVVLVLLCFKNLDVWGDSIFSTDLGIWLVLAGAVMVVAGGWLAAGNAKSALGASTSVGGVESSHREQGSPRRGWPSRIGLWGGAIAGVVGIVLIVVGTLAFVSASEDNASVDRARSQRQTLHVEEQRAIRASSGVLRSVTALTAAAAVLESTGPVITAADNAVFTPLTQAAALASAGDANGARSSFAAQADAIAALKTQWATARQALPDAKKSLADVQAKRGKP